MNDFESRLRVLNPAPVRPEGEYVLYWMVANRRLGWSFALDRAVAWARELGKPLLIFEALRCDYPWASERLHRFVLEGMGEKVVRLAGSGVGYFPYVEPEPVHGKGLLEALSARAALVVTDDAPLFFLPRMVGAAAERLSCRLEAVDSYGLLPLRAPARIFGRAFDFRRYLQRELPRTLGEWPTPNPLESPGLPRFVSLPREIEGRWTPASDELLRGSASALARLPIDHEVSAVAARGGEAAAEVLLDRFLRVGLAGYAESRQQPDSEAASGLSPYLHFGHISPHRIFAAVADREGWSPQRLGTDVRGAREGWWGMSASAEGFLDQLVTWRELGANAAVHAADYDRYESVPAWARATLEHHASDPRPALYDLEDFEGARTHDEIWNAAQRQLVREGMMHNYLRMLWGKKVIEWSPHPRQAAEILIHLNNKYALDGRNPNSYSGIFWCFGRYDRPWAPSRPIFGSVRFMSSDSTRRKLDLKRYLAAYGPQDRLSFSA